MTCHINLGLFVRLFVRGSVTILSIFLINVILHIVSSPEPQHFNIHTQFNNETMINGIVLCQVQQNSLGYKHMESISSNSLKFTFFTKFSPTFSKNHQILQNSLFHWPSSDNKNEQNNSDHDFNFSWTWSSSPQSPPPPAPPPVPPSWCRFRSSQARS